MSVAFRRESDEVHLEPRFELPLPPGPNPVTTRGLALIERHVAEREARLREMSDGDGRTAMLRELRYWRQRLATAEPMPPFDGKTVAFGARVRFRLDGRERTLDIVGHDEADTAAGQIASGAPLARALMGAEAGEALPFGGRDDAIELLAVSPIEA